MLDIRILQKQFSDFGEYQVHQHTTGLTRLKRAVDLLARCSDCWEDVRDHQSEQAQNQLVAGLQENPSNTYGCIERPTPLTVVATDGSQIYPDRNVEPTCYLLNVSRIVFQYGTLERPLIESVPYFRYRSNELEDLFDDLVESATTEVVSAIRDELELQQLYEVATTARQEGRPIVALADGTLIRWMLRRLSNPVLEKRLITAYTEVLSRFRANTIPICSYISLPGNTEVIHLLDAFADDIPDAEDRTDETLDGLVDRMLFEQLLEPGCRTATFISSSRIQKEYGADRICYFYVRVFSSRGGSEIGRVEFPQWVAERRDLVDLIHTTVVSECHKGEGYPMILSEAHEQAVVRARERQVFYELIDREMARAGLPSPGSRKAASKRSPLI